MSHLDPKRPATARKLREFGLLVGGAFTALAVLTLWRQKPQAVVIPLAVLGLGLMLAGLAVPRRLARVYQLWMAFALALSKVTTPIFMGVIYFGVLTPMGILMRLFGRNALVRSSDTGWRARSAGDRRSVLARQF
jgi:hypothetical protein